MLRKIFLLAVLTLPGVAYSGPAFAGLKICNETKTTRSVAIAFGENKKWTSEGWWVLKPGDCKTVVGGDLKQRYYYYHASARDIPFKGGKHFFCATSKTFTNVGAENCAERGYRRRGFRKIDTGKSAKSFKLTLTSGSAAPKAASPKAAEPGTHGEPATITGTFMGCRDNNDPPICEVVTDEWIYVVPKDDRTPASIYAALEKMPSGSTLTIEGDIVGYGDISVDMTARKVSRAAAESPQTSLHGQLLGAWRSLVDSQSAIRFENGQFYSYYGGDLIEKGRYALVQSCGGIEASAIAVDIDGDPETSCYGLLRIDDNRLELSYYPRGNTLSYKRDGH